MKSLAPKLAFVVICILIGVSSIYFLKGPQGVPRLLEKREEIRQLQDQNDEMAREIERKRDRIRRLKDSEAEQELEIRRRLKMNKKDETTFILPAAEKGKPPVQATTSADGPVNE